MRMLSVGQQCEKFLFQTREEFGWKKGIHACFSPSKSTVCNVQSFRKTAMDNSAAKMRKTRAENKPFYLPSGTTSAEIVAEARTSVRSVDTKRPCTPVEPQRTLFGANRRGSSQSRPPSSFSIGPRHFSDPDIPPPSTPLNRLEPLNHDLDIVDGKVTGQLSDRTENVVFQVDGNIRSLKLSKSIEPCQSRDGTSPERGPSVLCPSPPKPSRPLAAVKSCDTRRVHSGPLRRISPRGHEEEERAKSSPATGRHDNDVPSELEDIAKRGPRKLAEQKTIDDIEQAETLRSTGVFKEHIRPILKEMDKNLSRGDSKVLCDNCLVLSVALQNGGILPETKAIGLSSFKGQILKSLFGYLGLKDSRLHLRLAKIVLMFKVSDSNEENIFKLIFKISRDEGNDEMFMEENITEILIAKTAEFADNTRYEPWIYCTGALKLLSCNPLLRKSLVRGGCIEALGRILVKINKLVPTDGKRSKQIANLLIPVTAVLRNLADVSGSRNLFLHQNILAELMCVLGTVKNDSDVVLNICRILSKMTLYDECCSSVCSASSCFEAFLRILAIHLKSQEIVVRVLFILGNLTTKSDESRHNLYFTKRSMKYLLQVFQTYFERNIETPKNDCSKEKEKGHEKAEDVLNKIVRVIANLSIHPKVGPAIAKNEEVVELLVQILEVKDLSSSEELVLNTVATVNNLSYYTDKSDALATKRENITQLLMGLLVAENMDAILEATRVFGNFSRFKDVRDILSSHKVDEMMISLLDSGNHEIVYTACGVLINVMVDEEKRRVLKDEGGIKKLIDVLRDFGKIDWQLAAMVCQTLWNYGENMYNVYETFGEEETLVLIDLLREYLDEETALDYGDTKKIEPSVQRRLRDMWTENFKMVGEHLLRRIESKQSDLLPLGEST